MKVFVCLLLLFFSRIVIAATPDCKLSDASVEGLIAAKVKELNASEYCQYRIYNNLDDVDGDSKEDFIVVFTADGVDGGTNDHIQFLALFATENSSAPLIIQAGERGERDITAIQVEDRVIILKTLEYGKDDPMCCPSKVSSAKFQLKNGKLAEFH
jgi:hypothetical protein